MFWDKVAFIYDFFENVYNRKVYQRTGIEVSKNINADDVVLECACGTGAISIHLASACRNLTATDFSVQMKELERVCKSSGKIIIPTYINKSPDTSRLAVKFLEVLGADFKRQFDRKSYELFFENLGYKDVVFKTVEGRMPCCIAVIPLQSK